MSRTAKATIAAAGAVALVLSVVGLASLTGTDTAEISLAELDAALESGGVEEVVVDEAAQAAEVTLAGGRIVEAAYPDGFADALVTQALSADVEVSVAQTSVSSAGLLRVVPLLVVAALMVLLFVLVRSRVGGGGPGGNGGRPSTVPPTRFDDVAGVEEASAELEEVVSYLSDTEDFVRLGARAPKGVLLVGPPGTGKTLLARAVAGEAGVAFFALSGSDFVEKFAGVGASRVRKVFANARKAGRAIVFIDELDAVGKQRGGSLNSNDEREGTLNQLLVEMDGFRGSDVVVLAATNRADTLDSALTRPGRFDRQIVVAAPDRAARRAILELHLGDRPVDDVDVDALARRTPGLTGADLANLVNQAALAAARQGASSIGHNHMDEALATVTLGRERKSAEVLERDREITAWHEAGHTVIAMVHPDAADPAGVSIVPRGHAGGVTWSNGDDHQLLQVPQARAQLAVAMAGRAAEEHVYGSAYTQGASGDLRSATALAGRMAADYGMSPLVGPVHIPEDQRHAGEGADLLRRAVRELLVEALDEARALVEQHPALLGAVTEALLEHETLDSNALVELRNRVAGPGPSPRVGPAPDDVLTAEKGGYRDEHQNSHHLAVPVGDGLDEAT